MRLGSSLCRSSHARTARREFRARHVRTMVAATTEEGTMRKALLVCALALGAAGCGAGGEFVYRPVAPSGYVASGGPAARYVLPASAPTGEVRVDAQGVETITNRRTDVTYHALHVRLTVSNRSDTAPWVVDPNTQIANLPSRGWTAPFLTAIQKRTIDRPIEIAPGERRAIDLYYALPKQASKAERVPDFTLAWQVGLPEGVVTERTTFARLRLPLRSEPDQGYLLGQGYYDPFWHAPYAPYYTPFAPFP